MAKTKTTKVGFIKPSERFKEEFSKKELKILWDFFKELFNRKAGRKIDWEKEHYSKFIYGDNAPVFPEIEDISEGVNPLDIKKIWKPFGFQAFKNLCYMYTDNTDLVVNNQFCQYYSIDKKIIKWGLVFKNLRFYTLEDIGFELGRVYITRESLWTGFSFTEWDKEEEGELLEEDMSSEEKGALAVMEFDSIIRLKEIIESTRPFITNYVIKGLLRREIAFNDVECIIKNNSTSERKITLSEVEFTIKLNKFEEKIISLRQKILEYRKVFKKTVKSFSENWIYRWYRFTNLFKICK